MPTGTEGVGAKRPATAGSDGKDRDTAPDLRSPCAKKAAGLLRDPDCVREHAPNWGGAWPALPVCLVDYCGHY